VNLFEPVILLAIVANTAIFAYKFGTMSQKVVNMEDRLSRLSDKLAGIERWIYGTKKEA